MNNTKKPILKILHLEDDPSDIELIRSYLDAEGLNCEIVGVDNKDDFINILKNDIFDLILADYSLPMFDGLSALNIAKAVCPNVPFILLSGMLGEEFAIDSMKAGATDYVLKQRLSRLVPSINRAIREAEDRTQRIKAEEALGESEEKYKNLVDNIDIGVSFINPDMEIVTYNPRVEMWFPSVGLTNNGKRPLCYQIFVASKKPEKCANCPASKTFTDGRRHEDIIEIQTPDAIKNFRVISTPVKDSRGNITGIIEMMEDVTDKINIEKERIKFEERLQQAQKMEAIGTLAGGIAHDLNNILSPILAYTEIALMNLPDENPQEDNLKEIYEATIRARDLIKQILTFSSQKEEERRSVILSQIIDEVFKLLRPSIPSTIEIQKNVKAVSDMIIADPTQIHQVIMNLFTNASFAMREKGGILRISLKSVYLDSEAVKKYNNLSPGYYLELTVSDNGTGMNNEIKKRIFEPYFTTKDPGEGTGMGLAVIHGIIKSLNGDIVVESEPGKGSAFHVYFPKTNEDLLSAAEEFYDIPKGEGHILYVDDEEYIVKAMKHSLETLGYKVTAITNSKECLKIFTENPDSFDLVITDMTMPNLTGKELAREMLSIRPDIPIIICTGFSELIDENSAKEMGIKALLMKPFAIHEIAKNIRVVLQN